MSAVFALLLFGCSDDATMCDRIAALPQSYEQITGCEANLVQALDTRAARTADYPTVIAKCLPARIAASLGEGPFDLTRPSLRASAQAPVS